MSDTYPRPWGYDPAAAARGRMRLIGDADGLCRVVREGDDRAAKDAVELLGGLADPRATETLVWCLSGERESVAPEPDQWLGGDLKLAGWAAEALGRIRDQRAVPALSGLAVDPSAQWGVRHAAVVALGLCADQRALPALQRVLSNDSDSLKKAALIALGRLGWPGTVPAILASPSSLRHDGLLDLHMCRVLGELGDPRAVEALALRLASTNTWGQMTSDRCAAAEALGKIGTTACVPPLVSALGDLEIAVAAAVAQALDTLDGAGPYVSAALGAPDWRTRIAACGVLAERAEPETALALVAVLREDHNQLVRRAAAVALAHVGGPEAAQALVIALDDLQVTMTAADALARLADPPVRLMLTRLYEGGQLQQRAAARFLGRLGDPQHWSDLVSATKHKDHTVRSEAIDALTRLGDPRAGATLRQMATDSEERPALRARAVRALGTSGDPTADTALLLGLLEDQHTSIRLRTAEALGRLGGTQAASALAHTVRRDEDIDVRTAAFEALGSIGDTAVPELLKLIDETADPFYTAPELGLSINETLPRAGSESYETSRLVLRAAAVTRLGHHPDSQTITALARLTADHEVGLIACITLASMNDPRCVTPLLENLDTAPAGDRRRTIIEALPRFDDHRAVEAVLHYQLSVQGRRFLLEDLARSGQDFDWLRQG